MTFSLESRILLIYTIKQCLSVYTCTCILKPLFEASLLILLDELRICIGSLTHVRSLPACRQLMGGGGSEGHPHSPASSKE